MRILVTTSRFNRKFHASKIGQWSYDENRKAYVWGGAPMKPVDANAFFASKEYRQEVTDHGEFLSIQCVELKDMKAARAALERMKDDTVAATA